MSERQVPGGAFVNETGTFERQIPGGGFINETVDAGPGPTLSAVTATDITATQARLRVTVTY